MTATPAPADDSEADLQQRVDATLLLQAYGRQPLSLLMTAVVAPGFTLAFWPYFPGRVMLAWLAAMLAVTLARGFDGRAQARALRQGSAGEPQQAARWQRRFLVGSAAAGATWSLGPLLLLSMSDRTEWMLLALALVSVSAVSSVALGPLLRAMSAFQCLALLPTVVGLLATGGTLQRLTAAVLGSALAMLLTVGSRSHATMRSLVMTELRRASAVAGAQAASRQAQAASRAKSLFLANMSHELRTPLNAVIGAAQLMRAGEHDAARRGRLADAIERSGHTLLGLIDNILDLSRIEAGALVLLPQDFDLAEALDAVATTAGLAARAKGLGLSTQLDPALPRWRHGDAARVRQLLLNLLGNAVKFTAQGEVWLQVRPGPRPDEVQFEVHDTGIGIAAAALPHIFEPFRQADEGADRRYGGSGLGLAIVRELAVAMGGSVAAASVPGQGSCFTLVLRLPPPPRQRAAPTRPARGRCGCCWWRTTR